MDVARYIDAGIPIALGIILILIRKRRARKNSAGHPGLEQRGGRLQGSSLLLIGYGILMIAVHSLWPKAKVSEPPSVAWQTVTSSDNILAISMPGKPDVQTEDKDSELGRVRRVKHSLGFDKNTVIFGLDEIHYLDESLQFDPKEYADAMAEATVSKTQGSLLRKQVVRLGLIEGKEVAVRMAQGYVVLMRFFVVGRCLYQVKIVIPEAKIESAIVSRYFDSLSLRKRAT